MKADRRSAAGYPGNFHIGFFIDSEAEVDEIHQRLKEDGFEVTAPERHHGYTFYVKAPGGFTVELGA
jgi:catechol 2,3-dioxygenase-like lactoylglutathione lyase family enzyme